MEHQRKKKMVRKCDNPCYRPGAIWKTKAKIEIFPRHRIPGRKKKRILLPHNEVIMLLGYILDGNSEEHIEFLWKEKVYQAYYIDSGLYFHIDPLSINTKKNNASR